MNRILCCTVTEIIRWVCNIVDRKMQNLFCVVVSQLWQHFRSDFLFLDICLIPEGRILHSRGFLQLMIILIIPFSVLDKCSVLQVNRPGPPEPQIPYSCCSHPLFSSQCGSTKYATCSMKTNGKRYPRRAADLWPQIFSAKRKHRTCCIFSLRTKRVSFTCDTLQISSALSTQLVSLANIFEEIIVQCSLFSCFFQYCYCHPRLVAAL